MDDSMKNLPEVKKTKRKPTGAAAMGPGPGRPKGSMNKLAVIAKDAISMAAEGLGGVPRLIEWAKEDAQNERLFWATIYPKLLPLQVTGAYGRTLAQELSGLISVARNDE